MHEQPVLHDYRDFAEHYPYRMPRRERFHYTSHMYNFWTGCREAATHWLWRCAGRDTHQIGFYFNPMFYEVSPEEGCWSMARWFWYLEGEMGWDERTMVHRCRQHENAVVVKLADGWFQNRQSVSLATLMLRLGPYCKEGILMDDVFSKDLFAIETRHAIYRFLFGNQHYTGYQGYGWFYSFRNRPQQDVDRLLIPSTVVRDRAYYLWEQAGRPELPPDNNHFWMKACREHQYLLQPLVWC